MKDMTASGQDSLPLRPLAAFLLTLDWFIAAVTALAFLRVHDGFPPWFAAPFVGGVTVLSLVALLYYWQLWRAPQVSTAPGGHTTTAIWLLLICSVPCTSSLHKFYPFRTGFLAFLPSGFSVITYNFILTATSLVAVIIMAVLYRLHWRRAALAGLLILAAIMLIPNDVCGNDFNRPWNNLIGASPLMFAANAGVLLMGYCGLQGILPRASLVFMTVANVFVLFLGLGHITKVIW
jgi:hypothetical protein